ncbi:ERGIC3 [Lepeophtheirus salmonis]|uniref:ERGIC3 n=1 Tax=Lepeophtheirus salmonis TaxID=72036 RepID=A0A7R8CHM6_LEPSM|nr:ERGIC3 [Lepeophtheirus salmonis]CAF2769521.1 ERGIC3 [Lepeophtheirus salmonis]
MSHHTKYDLLSCLKVTQCSTNEIRDAPLYNSCSLPIQVITTGPLLGLKTQIWIVQLFRAQLNASEYPLEMVEMKTQAKKFIEKVKAIIDETPQRPIRYIVRDKLQDKMTNFTWGSKDGWKYPIMVQRLPSSRIEKNEDPLTKFYIKSNLQKSNSLRGSCSATDPLNLFALSANDASDSVPELGCALDYSPQIHDDNWHTFMMTSDHFSTKDVLIVPQSCLFIIKEMLDDKILNKEASYSKVQWLEDLRHRPKDTIKKREADINAYAEFGIPGTLLLHFSHYLQSSLDKYWQEDQKVSAIKLTIQVALMLHEYDDPSFYHHKFYHLSEIIYQFGKATYSRLLGKSPGIRINFSFKDVVESAQELTRNWFAKISAIRELLPRLYLETSLLKCYRLIPEGDYSDILSEMVYLLNNTNQTLDVESLKNPIKWILEGTLRGLISDFDKDQIMLKHFQNLDIELNHSGVLLNNLIRSSSPSLVSEILLQTLIPTILECKDESFSQGNLIYSLGKSLINSPEIPFYHLHRLEILKSVWSVATTIQDIHLYLDVSIIWVEFLCINFKGSLKELNILFQDIVLHLKENSGSFFGAHYRYQVSKLLLERLFRGDGLSNEIKEFDSLRMRSDKYPYWFALYVVSLTHLIKVWRNLYTYTKELMESIPHKTKGFVQASQIGLFNHCIGQADSCLRSALNLIPLMKELNETRLISCINNLLSTLILLPDSGEKGALPLDIFRFALNRISTFPSWTSKGLSMVYLNTLRILSVTIWERYPYEIKGLDSNAQLYCGNIEFIATVNCELSTVVLNHCLDLSIDEPINNEVLFELIYIILNYSDMSKVGLLMLFLFATEIREYLTPKIKEELFVDTSKGGKLKINLDIVFSSVGCDFLVLDAMDISGESHVDIVHNIYKRRLNLAGNPIEDPKRETQVGEVPNIKNKTEIGVSTTPSCGSCYGAETPTNNCCNTCAEVKEAYRKKGWNLVSAKFDQCNNGLDSENLERTTKEGCQIYGSLLVNRVGGSFHIVPGKSFSLNHIHIHDLQPFASTDFNTTHRIRHLSFGSKTLDGKHNVLDQVVVISPKNGMMYQYYLKIVPTTYSRMDGSTFTGNQYSVTRLEKDVSTFESGGMPEKEKSFGHFATGLCAIIGGIFTIAGIV